MGAAAGPDIVEDGLVLCLDAANERSYPGSGNTWYDLSGNGNDGTLVNGVGYDSGNGGSMAFDGVDDSIYVNDSSSLKIQYDKTYCIWIYINQNISSAGLLGKANSSMRGMALAYGWGNNGFQNIAWNSNNSPYLSKNTSDFENWLFITGVQNNNNRLIYVYNKNKVSIASSTGGIHSWNNSSRFGIGSVFLNDGITPRYYFSLFISNVQVYNRALSDAEIKQNFEATRSRYGI